MNCPNCNAKLEIDVDKKVAFCTYCGTQVLFDDESVNINYHYVDEARLKEAEIKKADVDLRQKRYEAEDLEYHQKIEDWISRNDSFKKGSLAALLAGFALMFIVPPDSAIWETVFRLLMIIIIGTLLCWWYLSATNPKKKYTKILLQREYEAEQRQLREKQYELEKERIKNQPKVVEVEKKKKGLFSSFWD